MTHPGEPSKPVKAAGRALAAGGAGYAIGGPEGAIVASSLSDVSVDLVQRAWEELSDRRQRSVLILVDRAAEDLGLGPRVMLKRALDEEGTTALLHQALDAASHTLNLHKVEGLARALANGLRDDAAAVDSEGLVVRALADLDNVHLKVLAELAARGRTSLDRLTTYTGLDRPVLEAVVAVLVRNHLVHDDTDFAGPVRPGSAERAQHHRRVHPVGGQGGHGFRPVGFESRRPRTRVLVARSRCFAPEWGGPV